MLKSGTFIKIAASAADVKMPANKAYLQIPTADLSSTGRGITIVWDETTPIDNSQFTIDNCEGSGVYDLSGRKVMSSLPDSSTPTLLRKGIYIVNGKKVVIK